MTIGPTAVPPDQQEPGYDYPRTQWPALRCRGERVTSDSEESGYLDSTDVFCPFMPGTEYTCTGGCPTNRERACILGEE